MYLSIAAQPPYDFGIIWRFDTFPHPWDEVIDPDLICPNIMCRRPWIPSGHNLAFSGSNYDDSL